MNGHDPLCPTPGVYIDDCVHCPLLFRVREDERASATVAALTQDTAVKAYAAALRDAVAAVKALGPVVDAEPDGHGGYRERRLEFACGKDAAVAAIEALGGER